MIMKFGKQLDVQKQNGSRGEFVGDDIQKHFGTEVFVDFDGALLGFDGLETHLENVGSIAEKNTFPCYMSIKY